jgi:hypothetical protein
MNGKFEQTYKHAWNSSAVTVIVSNNHRALTSEERAYLDIVLAAAENYANLFYPDGTLRPKDNDF